MIEIENEERVPNENSNVEYAIESCQKLIKQLKSGEFNADDIEREFIRLSRNDYRSYSEKRISYYFRVFGKGAWREVDVPRVEWTARNAKRTKTVEDVEYYVEELLAEDSKTICEPFLEEYRKEYCDSKDVWHIKPSVLITVVDRLKKQK